MNNIIKQELETLAQLRKAATQNNNIGHATASTETGIKWTLTKIAMELETAESPALISQTLKLITALKDQLFLVDYLENAGVNFS